MIEFKAWPKTPRLFRDMTITEKIDGTNGAVHIVKAPKDTMLDRIVEPTLETVFRFGADDEGVYLMGAQSRNRLITPGKQSDNHGFAAWVKANAGALVRTLGEGTHYGEWWGGGIARGYGLDKDDKRFSLFNVERYKDVNFSELPNVGLVPVLHEGDFRTDAIIAVSRSMRMAGSRAVPGYMNPEGIIVHHSASNQVFKVTLENDQWHKGKAA